MGNFLEGEIFFVEMTRIDDRVAKLGDKWSAWEIVTELAGPS